MKCYLIQFGSFEYLISLNYCYYGKMGWNIITIRLSSLDIIRKRRNRNILHVSWKRDKSSTLRNYVKCHTFN